MMWRLLLRLGFGVFWFATGWMTCFISGLVAHKGLTKAHLVVADDHFDVLSTAHRGVTNVCRWREAKWERTG